MAEGPVGNKGGSYVASGRYSFIGLIGAGGTAAIPDYRDVSFKIDFGNTKLGRFSIFGIGGTSDINFLGEEIDEDDLFSAQDQDACVSGCTTKRASAPCSRSPKSHRRRREELFLFASLLRALSRSGQDSASAMQQFARRLPTRCDADRTCDANGSQAS